MDAGLGSLGFGFLAGVLSILSPCVLPLLPMVLGSAVNAHRYGMPALAAGLVLAFVGVGLFVATIGFSIGLDGTVFRTISAVVLGVFGVVLLSSALQTRFAIAAGGVGDAGNRLLSKITPGGLGGQFLVGAVLGTIWSPCVGPTLGAASLLAAQGRDIGAVASVMTAFGLGAALPLVLIGSLSRGAMQRWRGRMMSAGKTGKTLLGAATLAVALLILTGLDHTVEAALVNATPAWLTNLTTMF